MLVAPFAARSARGQHHHHQPPHHHHHYRHHHHQQYDPVLASVQSALSRAGFYHTRIDGIYGSESAHAIRAFQRSKGMPETGVIDGNLLQALGLSIPSQPQSTPAAMSQQPSSNTQPTTSPAPSVTPATHSQSAATPTATPALSVPPGYQLVPINPPAAAVQPTASPKAETSPETTPIPDP